MSDTQKRVVLKFDVADAGAAAGLNKIGDAAAKAGQQTNRLAAELAKAGRVPAATPTGGGIFGHVGTRDQLILEAMRHAGYKGSGLTPGDLLGMTDSHLVGLRSQLATPTRPAPATLLGRLGGALSAGGGAVADGLGLGGLLRFGGPAAALTAAVAAVPSVAGGLHDADLVKYMGGTSGDQWRALANGNLISRNLLGAVDAVRGRPQEFARVDFDTRKRAVQLQAEEEKRQTALDLRKQYIAYESRYAALDADRRMAYLPAGLDRTTAGGQRAFGEAQQLLPSRQGTIDAQKDLRTAEEEVYRRRLLHADQARRAEGLERDEKRLMLLQGQATDGAERQAIGQQRLAKFDQMGKAQDELKALLADIAAAERRVVQARADVGRSKIETLQGEAGILGQRADVARSNALRIGMMDDVTYATGLTNLRAVKAGQFEYLSPEMISSAAGIDPEAVQDAAVARGTPRVRRDLLGQSALFRDDLPQVLGEQEKLIKVITDAIEESKREEARSQATLATKLKELFDQMNRTSDKKAQANLMKVVEEQAQEYRRKNGT